MISRNKYYSNNFVSTYSLLFPFKLNWSFLTTSVNLLPTQNDIFYNIGMGKRGKDFLLYGKYVYIFILISLVNRVLEDWSIEGLFLKSLTKHTLLSLSSKSYWNTNYTNVNALHKLSFLHIFFVAGRSFIIQQQKLLYRILILFRRTLVRFQFPVQFHELVQTG